jgi:hypothetical protein
MSADIYKVASELVTFAVTDGGVTLVRDTARMYQNGGFAVGGVCAGLKLDASRHEDAMNLDYLRYPIVDWLLATSPDVEHVGSWLDTDGSLYVDGVTIVADRSDAIALAVSRGELAIYDLTAGEEIRTPGNA